MCGFVGLYDFRYFNLDKFKKMSITINHRGPDADGYYLNKEDAIAFAHKRLSIIDLSSNGNQPFFSSKFGYSFQW